jgi:hypothetical protein
MSPDPPVDDRYGPALAQGTLFIGTCIRGREKDVSRQRRMTVALADQVAAYRELFPEAPEVEEPVSTTVSALIPRDWPAELATTYLIDLYFTRTFSPAELKFSSDRRDEALGTVAAQIQLTQSDIDSVIEIAKSAARAHRGKLDIGQIALIGGGAMLVLAVTAGMAAPVVAGAIGTAAGLSGAAAFAHGMAVLGLGSLAAGGFGMAGGLWIVTGAGAAVGALGGSTAAALVQLGPEAARTELIKLQTTTAAATLRYGRGADATQFVAKLLSDREEVRAQRTEALRRNEENAAVIERLNDIEDALGDAIRWINDLLEES